MSTRSGRKRTLTAKAAETATKRGRGAAQTGNEPEDPLQPHEERRMVDLDSPEMEQKLVNLVTTAVSAAMAQHRAEVAATRENPLSQAVDTHAATITGTGMATQVAPLDLHLTPKIKADIIGRVYVKFGQLLVREQRDNEKLTVKVANTNNGGQVQGQELSVSPYFNQVKITNINQWDRAHNIYMFTYLTAHPEEATGMVTYSNLIKDMAYKGFNWMTYDRKYRQLREKDHEKYPWGAIEMSLWAQYAVGQVPAGYQVIGNYGQYQQGQRFHQQYQQGQGFQPWGSNGPRQQGFGRGRGFFRRGRGRGSFQRNGPGYNGEITRPGVCFRFNRGEFCNQGMCRYQHACEACGGSHPAASCRHTQGQGTGY